MQRVVVTGMGTISPIGNSVLEFWNQLKKNQSGIAPITKFDPSEMGVHVAAEVKDFDYGKLINRKEAKRMDYFSQ